MLNYNGYIIHQIIKNNNNNLISFFCHETKEPISTDAEGEAASPRVRRQSGGQGGDGGVPMHENVITEGVDMTVIYRSLLATVCLFQTVLKVAPAMRFASWHFALHSLFTLHEMRLLPQAALLPSERVFSSSSSSSLLVNAPLLRGTDRLKLDSWILNMGISSLRKQLNRLMAVREIAKDENGARYSFYYLCI